MIRKATSNDIPQMLEVVKSNSENDEMIKRIEDLFRSAFIEHKFAPVYFVLEIDEKIVSLGGVAQLPINYRAYGLHSLWTHKNFQNKGYATEIVNARIQYVKSLRRHDTDDYLIFISTVIPDFFKKFGFEIATQFNVNDSKVMLLRV